MGTIVKFEDILAWQKARELNKLVYQITSTGSLDKDFGLRDQMRRSSVSIMSNIAEGYERKGDKEFLRYLNIAKGSCSELKSQTYGAFDVDFISKAQFDKLIVLLNETGKLINGFKSYLKSSLKT